MKARFRYYPDLYGGVWYCEKQGFVFPGALIQCLENIFRQA